jgi:hypothetical protein
MAIDASLICLIVRFPYGKLPAHTVWAVPAAHKGRAAGLRWRVDRVGTAALDAADGG